MIFIYFIFYKKKLPIANTRKGITQRIEENLNPHVNISASAVEHDINGKIHAITASKI